MKVAIRIVLVGVGLVMAGAHVHAAEISDADQQALQNATNGGGTVALTAKWLKKVWQEDIVPAGEKAAEFGQGTFNYLAKLGEGQAPGDVEKALGLEVSISKDGAEKSKKVLAKAMPKLGFFRTLFNAIKHIELTSWGKGALLATIISAVTTGYSLYKIYCIRKAGYLISKKDKYAASMSSLILVASIVGLVQGAHMVS